MNYVVAYWVHGHMKVVGPFSSVDEATQFSHCYAQDWDGWTIVEITNPDSFD